MNGNCERFRKSGYIQRQLVWHWEAVYGGDSNLFCKATVKMKTNNASVYAVLRSPRFAGVAFMASDCRPAHHPVADLNICYIRAYSFYCARKFMTKGERKKRLHKFIARCPFISMKIAATNSSSRDFYCHHARGWQSKFWNGNYISAKTGRDFPKCKQTSFLPLFHWASPPRCVTFELTSAATRKMLYVICYNTFSQRNCSVKTVDAK